MHTEVIYEDYEGDFIEHMIELFKSCNYVRKHTNAINQGELIQIAVHAQGLYSAFLDMLGDKENENMKLINEISRLKRHIKSLGGNPETLLRGQS